MAIKASQRRLASIIRGVKRDLLKNLDEQRPLERGAHLARRLMIERTRAGVDRHGRVFRYYRPSTAERKGRKSPVTLTQSGKMLNRMKVETYGYWGDARLVNIVPGTVRDRRIMRFHISGTRNMARRDFFGLTAQEEEQVRQFVTGRIKRSVPKDRRRRIEVQLFGF